MAPAASRFTAFDRLRGLIMVLMAVDHASFFLARTHALEDWANLPPFYHSHDGSSVALAFITRWLTHLCAPGFFLLMGAGMVWLGKARQKDGWSHARIRRFFLTRGAILIVAQHFVENPAWVLGIVSAAASQPSIVHPPGGGSDPMLHFGVISTLGVAMIVWAFLIELPTVVVLLLSGVAVAASVFMTPPASEYSTLFPAWKLLLFVPSHANIVDVLFPIVPWLAPAGLGIVLARLVTRKPGMTVLLSAVAGGGLLVAFFVMRTAALGDPHAPLPGIIGFLSVTKYPPSPAFLSVMLGIDLVLIAIFALTASMRLLSPLDVFGRSPLFFYFLHLYVFGALSFAFRNGTSFAVMYLVWAVGLVAMYPACVWYGRFKASKPLASAWRML